VQTPEQLYLHGMVQNGVRGVHVEDPDDLDIYEIDWEDVLVDHPRLRNHHNTHNPEAPWTNHSSELSTRRLTWNDD